MTGISRLTGGVALLLAVLAVACSGKNSFDLSKCQVSGIQVGMAHKLVLSIKKGTFTKRQLRNGIYELEWPDETAVSFESTSNTVVEVYGTALKVDSRQIIVKGMNSAKVLSAAEVLHWPSAVVVSPGEHSWTKTELSKMEYCTLHYRFKVGRISVSFSNDKVDSIVAAVR